VANCGAVRGQLNRGSLTTIVRAKRRKYGPYKIQAERTIFLDLSAIHSSEERLRALVKQT
jgi:hypothetical protein